MHARCSLKLARGHVVGVDTNNTVTVEGDIYMLSSLNQRMTRTDYVQALLQYYSTRWKCGQKQTHESDLVNEDDFTHGCVEDPEL